MSNAINLALAGDVMLGRLVNEAIRQRALMRTAGANSDTN